MADSPFEPGPTRVTVHYVPAEPRPSDTPLPEPLPEGWTDVATLKAAITRDPTDADIERASHLIDRYTAHREAVMEFCGDDEVRAMLADCWPDDAGGGETVEND